MCAQRRLWSAWASAQSDQSSLCGQRVAKDPSFLHADSEDSDQTERMSRLIWVFAAHLSSLGAQPHCWFCHVAAQLLVNQVDWEQSSNSMLKFFASKFKKIGKNVKTQICVTARTYIDETVSIGPSLCSGTKHVPWPVECERSGNGILV